MPVKPRLLVGGEGHVRVARDGANPLKPVRSAGRGPRQRWGRTSYGNGPGDGGGDGGGDGDGGDGGDGGPKFTRKVVSPPFLQLLHLCQSPAMQRLFACALKPA